MNDTKWREVFTLIVTRGIWFQIQLIDWSEETLSILLRQYHPTVFKKHPKGYVDGVLGSASFCANFAGSVVRRLSPGASFSPAAIMGRTSQSWPRR